MVADCWVPYYIFSRVRHTNDEMKTFPPWRTAAPISTTTWNMVVIGGSNHSSNNRLISDLPLRVYVKLICGPRSVVNPIDGPTLRSQILSKLHNANIADIDYSYGGGNCGKGAKTIRDILHISPPILLRILDPCLTYVECNRFLSRIHAECSVHRLSALEVIRSRTKPSLLHKRGEDLDSNDNDINNDDDLILLNGKISTGLPTLDGCLRGGIPIGSITEVVGRAGVGKTHLAQQLIVQAAMGGGGSIFIDAEKKLSLQRLRELALERRRREVAEMPAHANTNQNSITDFAQQVLENVTIHSLLTTRELLDVLDNLEKEILLRNSEATNEGTDHTASNNNNTRRLPVRLIVIDSIAAPIRRDFDMMVGSSATSSSSSSSSSNTAANRASAIFQIAKRLKQLAHDFQLAVVVVNQVGSGHDNSISSHNNNINQRNNTLDINDGEFTASLGTAWQYCATTRIVLEHEDDPHRLQQAGVAMYGSNNNGVSIRSATLTKCLTSKKTRLTFELIQQGLVEVPTPTN